MLGRCAKSRKWGGATPYYARGAGSICTCLMQVHKSRVGPAIYAWRLLLTLQMHFSPPRLLGLENFGWRKCLYFFSLGFLQARFFIFNVNSEIAWSHRPDLFIKAKNKNSALKIPWRYVLWVIYLSKAYSQNACRRRKILPYFGRLYALNSAFRHTCHTCNRLRIYKIWL